MIISSSSVISEYKRLDLSINFLTIMGKIPVENPVLAGRIRVSYEKHGKAS